MELNFQDWDEFKNSLFDYLDKLRFNGKKLSMIHYACILIKEIHSCNKCREHIRNCEYCRDTVRKALKMLKEIVENETYNNIGLKQNL